HGFDFVKEQLDDAASKGLGWVVFVSHVDQGEWYSESYVRQIIEYALSLGFKSCTTKEGIERFGNIAQFGNNKIGADGSVHGNKIGRVQYKPRTEGVTFDAPITDFELNTETFTDINSANAGEWPLGFPGVVRTKRYASDAYGFQSYRTSREGIEFDRQWDVDNSKWQDFKRVNIMQYFGRNGIGINQSPREAPLRYKISYSHIDSAGNIGFPENKS